MMKEILISLGWIYTQRSLGNQVCIAIHCPPPPKKIKKQTKQNKETLLIKTDLSREARDLTLTSDCYFYSNGEEEGSHSI